MKIKKPTLLIDKNKVVNNIARIASRTGSGETQLWPHFKTHQSVEIGEWFKDYSINGITVSSVSMARYFARAGWQDIYIAFPLNVNEIEEIAELASAVNLMVLVNDKAQVSSLNENVTDRVLVKIEIETGAHRSGIQPTSINLIQEIINLIDSGQHEFDGFYSHFGHTYRAQNKAEVESIFNESYALLSDVKENFSELNPTISLGDTPSASVLQGYPGISSLHAGNYVFYDLTQSQIGVCDEQDIGIALAVPVVSKNRESQELVVYGGGVHLSKENMYSREFDTDIFGKIVELHEEGWSASLDNCYVRAISQEHGVIKVTSDVFDKFKIGK